MKRQWLSSMLFAAVMMVSSVAFASPFMDTGVLNADPVYAPTALLAADSPTTPAMKPNNDGFEQTLSVTYFKLPTVYRMPKTLVACGVASELDETPMKIPILL